MKIPSSVLLLASLLTSSAAFAQAGTSPCETGVYRKDAAAFVAITIGGKGHSYTFSDGRSGDAGTAGSVVQCGMNAVLVGAGDAWPRVHLIETDSTFVSDGILLAGRLMAPPGAGPDTPLVVYAHGSENSGWIDRARDPYQLLGRGVAVFVYDKRGTGLSGGVYTQNFPRLADDLVAASREALRLAQGRYGRFGLIGVSQGGWIAPLAAMRAQAQFIGIGYGLAIDIAEQDAAQVALQLRDKGYGEDVIALARGITQLTAQVAKSGAKQGLDELAAVQRRYGREPWFSQIKGGYSGVLLNVPAEDLRNSGMAEFDKLEVDWSQSPMQVLATVNVPQLWALAAEDRQAPIAETVERLAQLRDKGSTIALYVFPHADHGMRNVEVAADGTRKRTMVTAGYYDLMADWAKGRLADKYGEAQRK